MASLWEQSGYYTTQASEKHNYSTQCPKKVTPYTMYDSNGKSECIISKCPADISEYICERTIKFR